MLEIWASSIHARLLDGCPEQEIDVRLGGSHAIPPARLIPPGFYAATAFP